MLENTNTQLKVTEIFTVVQTHPAIRDTTYKHHVWKDVYTTIYSFYRIACIAFLNTHTVHPLGKKERICAANNFSIHVLGCFDIYWQRVKGTDHVI